MKNFLVILILTLLVTRSFAQSEVKTELSSQQKENTSSEIEEKDNIREVALRYLFDHNDSDLQKKASTYFILVEGIAPSKEFLERFNNHKPTVRSKTEATYKKKGHYWVFDVNSKPSLVFYLGKIKNMDDKTIEIRAAYYEGGLSSAEYAYQLVKMNGRWVVVKKVLKSVS